LLPAALVTAADPRAYADAWQAALRRAPSARHRVLVAVERGAVVGFAALAPSGDADADPVADAELVALHVEPGATGRGHGSRLLTAAVDTARADGSTTLRTWVLVGDDPLRAFLAGAGWEPDGAHRGLDLAGDAPAGAVADAPGSTAGPPAGDAGTTVLQVRLHTGIDRPAPGTTTGHRQEHRR
jgi:GNAT superfamily N-acetyltransferase